MKKIAELCMNYNLGNLIDEPKFVTGGLMHKMYQVSTDQGEYAIKLLNPDIMKRPEALTNMIHSELLSNALSNVIPLVAAKTFHGRNIIEMDDSFFVVFDWLDGNPFLLRIYLNIIVSRLAGCWVGFTLLR